MQDYDNEPNDQHQLPREHNGERADGRDADSREKPAEQPNQSGGTQEVESGKCQKQQNDEHFFLFSFLKYDGFVCGKGRFTNKRVICQVICDER